MCIPYHVGMEARAIERDAIMREAKARLEREHQQQLPPAPAGSNAGEPVGADPSTIMFINLFGGL